MELISDEIFCSSDPLDEKGEEIASRLWFFESSCCFVTESVLGVKLFRLKKPRTEITLEEKASIEEYCGLKFDSIESIAPDSIFLEGSLIELVCSNYKDC